MQKFDAINFAHWGYLLNFALQNKSALIENGDAEIEISKNRTIYNL